MWFPVLMFSFFSFSPLSSTQKLEEYSNKRKAHREFLDINVKISRESKTLLEAIPSTEKGSRDAPGLC